MLQKCRYSCNVCSQSRVTCEGGWVVGAFRGENEIFDEDHCCLTKEACLAFVVAKNNYSTLYINWRKSANLCVLKNAEHVEHDGHEITLQSVDSEINTHQACIIRRDKA